MPAKIRKTPVFPDLARTCRVAALIAALGAFAVEPQSLTAGEWDDPAAADNPPEPSPQSAPRRGRRSDLVFKDQIIPRWFAGHTRFWYRNDRRGGAR